jgi:hypothetical protein
MSLDDYVQVALSIQYSESQVGKPFQPEENDSFVIQASFNCHKYDVILGKQAPGFGSGVVMRIKNGDKVISSLNCRRLAHSNTWILIDRTQLFGEYPEDNFCPAELNKFFNWCFRKYYLECANYNELLIPDWTNENYANPSAPQLKDTSFKAQLEALRLEEERKEEEKRLAEERRLLEERRQTEIARLEKERLERVRIENERRKAEEKVRLENERREAEEKVRREAEEKALKTKLDQSKKWFVVTMFNKNFDRTQSFGSQMLIKLDEKELEMLNNLLKDAQVGKSKIETWWNEFKNQKIDF